MNGLDWLILMVVAASVLMAAGQGFFIELFSLAGAVLGFMLAAWNHAWLAAWFAPYVKR
ncbi:MAG: CvpA family protein, partial [Terriglobales bacterium]